MGKMKRPASAMETDNPEEPSVEAPSDAVQATPEVAEAESVLGVDDTVKKNAGPVKKKPAKAKAAPRSKDPKAKIVLKKPSKADPPKPAPKPDPKPSKKSSIMDQAKLWKQGRVKTEQDAHGEGSEEGDGSKSKEEDTDGEYRDKGKGQKWKKMCDQHAIPSHILDMFHKESKKQKEPRKWKTQIINKPFKKNPTTKKYDMVADQPWFNSFRGASTTDFGVEQTKGKPKSVFLHSKFHGRP